MEGKKKTVVNFDKISRLMLLSRMANGDELLPLYEPSADDVYNLFPVHKMFEKVKRLSRRVYGIKKRRVRLRQ